MMSISNNSKELWNFLKYLQEIVFPTIYICYNISFYVHFQLEIDLLHPHLLFVVCSCTESHKMVGSLAVKNIFGSGFLSQSCIYSFKISTLALLRGKNQDAFHTHFHLTMWWTFTQHRFWQTKK